MVPDYWHLLTTRAKYVKDSYYTITGATNASPIRITIGQRNNLRTGQKVSIANVGGNTNANGVRYIKTINSYQFEIYADKDLQTPIVGNAAYTSGGEVLRIFYEYCERVFSDQKLAPFKKSTIDIPGVEVGDNFMKFYPADETCSEISLDYIALPTGNLIIDITNNIIDLEIYYPQKFLFFILEEAVIIFSDKTRDTELRQTAQATIVQNP
jgi:hypothetical protein